MDHNSILLTNADMSLRSKCSQISVIAVTRMYQVQELL